VFGTCSSARDGARIRAVLRFDMKIRLPSKTEFQLLALVAKERTGREVGKAFEEASGRAISYGTLYVTFGRLKEAGLVTTRDDKDDDGRLRWFRITAAGSKAVVLARDYYRNLSSFGEHQ
jgi:DNA-binding PadR family transcriptional regulator